MKNNYGLVEHCKKALKESWGYVYGTFGQILTKELINYKLKQYPDNIKKYQDYIKNHYIGRRVTDCVGLIKSFLWWDGNNPIYDAKTDKSANGMFETANTKWPIDTLPELPGILVWKSGHIGVYIGNGQVIESKGTKYGVVQTPLKGLSATKWTHWCLCPYIEYTDAKSYHKAVIQAHCQFSHPQGVWELLDKHPYANDLYRKWAESYIRLQ